MLPALVLAVLALASMAANATLTYTIDTLGVAHVIVVVTNVSNETEELHVPLEPGAVMESVIASSLDGDPLPCNASGGSAVVLSLGARGVVVSYDAVVGAGSEGVVEAVIHPWAPATVYLPQGAALVYANGTPSFTIASGRIVLHYNTPGVYRIVFIAVQAVGNQREEEHPSILPFVVVGVAAAALALLGYHVRWRRVRRVGEEVELLGGLDERDRAIIRLLEEEGPLTMSEIAGRLGLSRSTVHRRLQRLVRMGLLEREARGKSVLYRVARRGAHGGQEAS